MGQELVRLGITTVDNGAAFEALEAALGRVVSDALDRWKVNGARKAVLTIEVKPDANYEHDDPMRQPEISWQVKTSVPVIRGRTVRGLVENGSIVVNVFEPETPAQGILPNVARFGAVNGEGG